MLVLGDKKMNCGFDEAGRGALLGALVIAGACFLEEDLQRLKDIGVKDSKLLSPKKRDELAIEIKKIAKRWDIVEITANQIDQRFKSGKNLNILELDGFSTLIKNLKPKKAYIDCFYKDPEKLKNLLSKETKSELIVEHKADMNYLVVGAASILAKTQRDDSIKDFEKETGKKIGSGYPSDSVSRKFVEENMNLPFIRKTWASYENIKGKKQQTSLGQFE